MRRPVLIPAAVVVAALASGSQPRPAPDPVTSGVLVHVAFMMGSRTDAPLPAVGAMTSDPRAFDSWDPTADNPELQHLLGLRRLTELSRATLTMPPDQHFVSLAVVADARRYELSIEPTERRDRIVYLGVSVKEDGKAVSRPRLGLELGQKGVVCARVARADGEAFVFFVLEMDEL